MPPSSGIIWLGSGVGVALLESNCYSWYKVPYLIPRKHIYELLRLAEPNAPTKFGRPHEHED